MSKITVSVDTVYIYPKEYQKLFEWVKLAPGEISFMGLVEDQEGQPCISKIFLLEQECTSAETDIDQKVLGALQEKLLRTDDSAKNMRAWIHSHADMSTFWSGTDKSTIESFGTNNLFVSIVVNKKHEIKCRIDIYRPVRMTIDDMPLVCRMDKYDIAAECEAEFKEKVHTPSVALPTYTRWGIGSKMAVNNPCDKTAFGAKDFNSKDFDIDDYWAGYRGNGVCAGNGHAQERSAEDPYGIAEVEDEERSYLVVRDGGYFTEKNGITKELKTTGDAKDAYFQGLITDSDYASICDEDDEDLEEGPDTVQPCPEGGILVSVLNTFDVKIIDAAGIEVIDDTEDRIEYRVTSEEELGAMFTEGSIDVEEYNKGCRLLEEEQVGMISIDADDVADTEVLTNG